MIKYLIISKLIVFYCLGFLDSLTADAWHRFSVLRLRQRNGAKRLLPAGLFLSYYSLF
jgi:hypothetical protein